MAYEFDLSPRYSYWNAQARPEIAHPFVTLWNDATGWIERARQRAALSTLDDAALRDIGITRVEAERECRKPFWR